MSTSMEMPRYKCHKEVWALKIDKIEPAAGHPAGLGQTDGGKIITPADTRYAPFRVDVAWLTRNPKVEAGGYYVVYAQMPGEIENYTAYSPAEAFEDGYTLAEKATTARDTGGMEKMLDNNFRYHPPKGDQAERYQLLRDQAKVLAKQITSLSPPSREQSLALTKLEEAVMWANAGIARNE